MKSIENARRFMEAAARGETKQRSPISLATRPDGSYAIVDGNATARAAARMGLRYVRAKVVGNDLGTRLANSVYAVKSDDSGLDADGKLRIHGLEGLSFDAARERAYEMAKENNGALRAICEQAGKKLGAKTMMRDGVKSSARADEKARNDYAGDYSRVVDLIGGTLVLNEDMDYSDAMKALRKAAEANGATVARVKKFNMNPGSVGYSDLKISVRFANGGIGEVIVVSEFMLDGKNNRGGHKVYEATRLLEKNETIADKSVKYALVTLKNLEKVVYSRKVSLGAFERAKERASSSLTRLTSDDKASRISLSDINMLKSLSSGIHFAKPPSVDSYATPARSLIQNDISYTSINSSSTSNIAQSGENVNGDGARFSVMSPEEAERFARETDAADGTQIADVMRLAQAISEKDREFITSQARKFFRIARNTDELKAVGISGDYFTIRIGVLTKHDGKDIDHTISPEQLATIASQITQPIAVMKLDGSGNERSYRVWLGAILNGKFTAVGVDVKNAGRDIDVNEIRTVFGDTNVNVDSSKIVYPTDDNEKNQAVRTLLDGPNPRQYSDQPGSATIISQNQIESQLGMRPGKGTAQPDNPTGETRSSITLPNMIDIATASLAERIRSF